MAVKIDSVETYFEKGCGRCKKFDTPECRVHRWDEALAAMRAICLESGMQEELKWAHPCYLHEGRNIVILGAFNEYCAINFMKGGLLKDPKKLLENNGENSQSSMMFRAQNAQQVLDCANDLKALIQEAIEVEKAGLKIAPKSVSEYEVPEELTQKFAQDSSLEIAFNALTPGRQKAYLLLFGQAKQSATRFSRIEKYEGAIRAGKGPHDDYKC